MRRSTTVASITTLALLIATPALAALAPDTSFDEDGYVTENFTETDQGTAVAVGNGRTYVAQEQGTDVVRVIAYTNSGGHDDTFGGGDGVVDLDLATISDLEVLASGKIALVGDRIAATPGRVVRLTSEGTPDSAFSDDGFVSLPYEMAGVAEDSQGRLVVAGTLVREQSPGFRKSDFGVARIKAGGALDANFSGDGKATLSNDVMDDVEAVDTDSKDRPVVAGVTASGPMALTSKALVARWTAGGKADANFSGNGKATASLSQGNNSAVGVGTTGSDKVVLAMTNQQKFGGVRLTAAGDLDANYSGDGKVAANLSDLNGSIYGGAVVDGVVLVTGAGGEMFDELLLGRVSASGTLDVSVGANGGTTYDLTTADDYGNAIAVDGSRVVVAGYTVLASDLDLLLARFSPTA